MTPARACRFAAALLVLASCVATCFGRPAPTFGGGMPGVAIPIRDAGPLTSDGGAEP